MKASFRAIFALTTAAVAAPVLAQTPVPPSQLAKPAGPPPAVNIPGVSPAGNALLTKLQSQRDPVLIQLAGQQRNAAQQMVTIMSAPTIDVEKFAALLKQSEGLTAQIRSRSDDKVLQALRALPAADRGPFLRGVVSGGQRKP